MSKDIGICSECGEPRVVGADCDECGEEGKSWRLL